MEFWLMVQLSAVVLLILLNGFFAMAEMAIRLLHPAIGAEISGIDLGAPIDAVTRDALSQALAEFYKSGSRGLLDRYSDTCLRRVWRAQRFSWWMTSMLHVFGFGPEHAFDRRRQLAELDYLTSSRAAMTSLAENYVGFPIKM